MTSRSKPTPTESANPFSHSGLAYCLSLLTVGLFVGCGSKSPEQGSGVAITEERQLDYFEKVNVTGLGKVVIRFGTTDRCTVRTDDNLIDQYETRIKNGTLFLAPTRFMAPRSGITTTIDTSQTITSIEATGACQIVLQKFSGDELSISGKNACEFTAGGSTKTLTIDVDGSTELDLFNLKATDVAIQAKGTSKINVHSTGTLEVIADGAVVVTYEGDAEVTESLSGVSKIQRR